MVQPTARCRLNSNPSSVRHCLTMAVSEFQTVRFRTMKLYQKLATLLQAIDNCQKSGNTEWHEKHRETLHSLCSEHMPRGSGFDNGTTLQESTPNRITFGTAFHHMDESGSYDGWTDHTVIITPDLVHGFNLRITGRDRNQIKEYMHECFAMALKTPK
jgi:hypothetical protein